MSSTPLWPHQRKALDGIRKYLTAAAANKDLGSALVHMPTGTGKTGVIACAAHFLSAVGTVLVLSPRVSLRDQLAEEIGGRFFTKLGLTGRLPKKVVTVSGTFPPATTLDLSRTIFVMTIQMLQSTARRNAGTYTLLRNNVDIVIVDEGHYEPAISWRDAIRGLGSPKVLFTATPFRNDLKLFDVEFAHAVSYTFGEAVRDNTIRSVTVHPRPPQPTPIGFTADVLQFYDQTFPNAATTADPPRVIVRCDSDVTIRQIGAALAAAGRSFVLIHERFADGDPTRPHERQSVPDPLTHSAVFWVHQFKLLEGIDDPRFRVIALFEELTNTRGLVQQIGRVIRNPLRSGLEVGHFLDHSDGRQIEMWNDFLAFDTLLERDGVKVADFGAKILKAVQASQPDIVYLDGRFRSPLQLNTIHPASELLLPKTVNVLRTPAGFNLDDAAKQIQDDFERMDRDVRRHNIDQDTVVFVYLDFENSPLLRSQCFIECCFGAALVRRVGDYVFAYDSQGGIPPSLADICDTVDVATLRRLFPKNKETYLTSVSLHSAQLGARVIRSRSISASRVEDTVPAFDDYAFVCHTVLGKSTTNGVSTRRYVGFGRGKVTDVSFARVLLPDYIKWLDGIAVTLASASTPISSFTRFAKDADRPADTTPRHVLLDVREIETEFHVGRSETLELEDACSAVSSGAFSVTANGHSFQGSIAFSDKTGRYDLDIPDLDAMFTTRNPQLKTGIVRYLNHHQSFRIIPGSAGVIYTLGAFYKPAITFGVGYDDEQWGVLKVLHPFACLSAIGSEKGARCSSNGANWDPQSLFSIVDLLGVGHSMDSEIGNPNIVVCDDLGTEAADFILGYTAEKRVVFVHCKGKGSHGHGEYSASGLQDVCGQATKNLRYFSRFGGEVPPKARVWHSRDWHGAKGVTGRVHKRIRKGPAGAVGTVIWKELQSIIRDPYSDLQVWMMLGRMLKKSEFQTQLTGATPAAEAEQAAYLLFSTMNDVASVGARLKVFCSP